MLLHFEKAFREKSPMVGLHAHVALVKKGEGFLAPQVISQTFRAGRDLREALPTPAIQKGKLRLRVEK